MRRFFIISPVLPPLILATLLLSSGSRAADNSAAGPNTIAVVDFDYLDTSGEERDQRQEHEARLKDFMAALRSHLAAQGKVIVTPNCHPTPCSAARTPADDLLRAAREAGADIMVVGAVQKMSTLIQWAKAGAIHTGTGQMLLDKLYTFRGDNDESWRRAEAFIAGEMASLGQASR